MEFLTALNQDVEIMIRPRANTREEWAYFGAGGAVARGERMCNQAMFAIPSTPMTMWPPHGDRSFLSLKSVKP